MLLSLVYLVVRMLLRLLVRDGQGEAAKDLEIVVLRHQLNVLFRQVNLPRFRRSDRAFLAAAARRLPRVRWERFLVTPKTLLRWHRELVRLKWARYSKRHAGRLPLPAEAQELILRLAKENPRWGYKRIQGELQKLGIKVSATAIRKLLARRGLGPAPPVEGTRPGDSSWPSRLRAWWRATSSPSKPWGSSASTCWYSLSSPSGVSTSPAARRTPIRPGWSSRRGTSRSTLTNEKCRCGFSSMTATPSSAVPSMTCSQPRNCTWSALPSGLLVPMLCVSDGSEPLGRSASTGCSSSPVATSSASSRSTFAITTNSDLTVRCNSNHRCEKSSRKHRFPLTQGCVGEIDLAGCCTNIMRRQHDGTEFVHPSPHMHCPNPL